MKSSYTQLSFRISRTSSNLATHPLGHHLMTRRLKRWRTKGAWVQQAAKVASVVAAKVRI